ncbi:hypothetical protein [Pseudorhodobacter sp.]|uniref:hypothetical protein n=1 Tax=Pseudorhodobacter sp. TaxID=1934400 RepID=UPI002AFF9D1B|nr:hypothetical protein [Pseudorhodobacter sp.]
MLIRNVLMAAMTGLCVSVAPVYADTCDYRPSRILGDTGSKAAIGGALGVSSATGAATAMGVYTLVNAGSGLTMLGSTLAGGSAAGTIGIIAGTGGALGTAGAIILNPLVWVPAAIVGVGGGGFEAVCAFLVDERITEYEEVLAVMKSFAAHADTEYFRIVTNAIPAFISLSDGKGSWTRYDIEDLYIVDGMLINRDWGPNTNIGRVVLLNNDGVVQSEIKKE